MKLELLVSAMLLCGIGATAQNPHIALVGANEQNGAVVVSQPATTLAVDVTVEQDKILCGPYARYAQKFLGVRAPLTDKTTYTLTGATVSLLDGDNYFQAKKSPARDTRQTLSHTTATDEFTKLQPDKTDILTLPLEDAARDAATTIFSLRKHRLELITGEAGENVFGEGLKSALKQIELTEQSYLELFLGKHVVYKETKRYVVLPKENRKQYIVCRFNETAGLLSDNDLSGEIVLLQITPSGDTGSIVEATPRETNTVTCRVADAAECAVIFGGRELTQAVLPIFEFGRTIKVALPRKK